MRTSLLRRINITLRKLPHPRGSYLSHILAGKTSLSTTGYPYISERSFRMFLARVPHLFTDGQNLLIWLSAAEMKISQSKELSQKEKDSILLAIRVLRTVVYSASICAPPDLWILRHVLSVHAKIGTLKVFLNGERFNSDRVVHSMNLDQKHLSWDLSLLHCRGLLDQRGKFYSANPNSAIFRDVNPVPDEFLCDMVEPILEVMSGAKSSANNKELVSRFLSFDLLKRRTSGWIASINELEIGYRLVPLVLALHAAGAAKQCKQGTNIVEVAGGLTVEMKRMLQRAGMIQRGRVTEMGARIFQRGPGPFGIIHAYVPYMRVLKERLLGTSTSTWVQRGKNIAASQDANRKTFEMANSAFDRFSADHQYTCSVFIEHALGQGEATRQRFQKSGEDSIQYFGADLEDAAIDKAIALQQQGILPKNMIFIRNADIGKPSVVIDAVKNSGFHTRGSVMFVGNGFHEVRGQTNQKIVDVFREYCSAGIIIIFTEESALGDYDLLHTGWNTYHAGFRYVHELSGQGLRPVFGTDRFGRHSWKICASLGGYAVLSKYCEHTRTIYPFPRKGGYNPPISMTYFCVPSDLTRSLGYFPRNWSHSEEGISRQPSPTT